MDTVGEDCNFEALPSLVAITKILVPIIVRVPAAFLIPNVLQTENLIDWEKEGWYSHKDSDDELERSELLVTNEDDDDSMIYIAGSNTATLPGEPDGDESSLDES